MLVVLSMVAFGWTVFRSDVVGAAPRPAGFDVKGYAGDVWLAPSGVTPPRQAILARVDGFPDNTTCTGREGTAIALKGRISEDHDLRSPHPGCAFTLTLPDHNVLFFRVRTHGKATFELRCFGPVAEAEAVRAACNAVYDGLAVAP